ncbi:hypothetical protein DVU_0324 [Nitratidesulfovibrio vulgaris str. Hildenborough]|uniref:Uncharacterized protein n=1 Tax=Nitratidesulfovibrio vulgaris (strain ATCC 29579 / DSM 644 / CCUG 34227 / NCIMB 8303 / VKM B-1760 / Hildenborough) TaxID=882 RepID=Q72F90_NITV2|nr:hypothetical protein DVU_0324 [Nitratidesulfovibrio vulgaris str. Hildenborough]
MIACCRAARRTFPLAVPLAAARQYNWPFSSDI